MFLESVLPEGGNYAVFVSSASGKYHKWFTDIPTMEQYMHDAARDCDVYFALATFASTAHRSQDNVQAKKAYYLDIDCGEGKPYANKRDGALALAKFCKTIHAPSPTIVDSGRGIHAYWALQSSVSPQEWRTVAEGLKRATKTHGLHADPAVTADSARVLRAPGTINHKCGNTVTVLVARPAVDPGVFAAVISAAAPAPAGRTRTSSVLGDLAGGEDYPTCNSEAIEQRCPAIAKALQHPEAVPEPLWYKMVGLAAYCTSPEATALRWSKGHPDFDPDKTIRKMEQYRASTSGAPLCEAIQGDCKECAKCPFRGKIRTPWVLGITYKDAPPVQEEGLPPAVAPPEPYRRTVRGIVKNVDGADLLLCDFDLYPLRYGKNEQTGVESVFFRWNRVNFGWADLAIPNACLYPQAMREFVKQLGDQGVLIGGGLVQEFQIMLNNYVQELRRRATMTNVYATFGWKENNTAFAIGNTLIRNTPQGVVEEPVSASDVNSLSDILRTSGSRDNWVKATGTLPTMRMPFHMFALGIAFAAPLYIFTGLKGAVVSLYGETGGGKTLAQKWMQSVYGDPEGLHFASRFTANALYTRMSLLNNLPMTVDEATMMDNAVLGDILFSVTQGRDKARLSKAAIEVRAKEWAMPVVFSTNMALSAKMHIAGYTSEAQRMRLLELRVPVSQKLAESSDLGRKIHTFLSKNYGHVGREYLRYLVGLGEEKIRADIDAAFAGFKEKFDIAFTGSERYWELVIVTAWLGLRYAKSIGVIEFEPDECIPLVLAQLALARKDNEENREDIYDIITRFCNDSTQYAVTAMYTGKSIIVDQTRLPRDKVLLRYNLWRKAVTAPFTDGTLIIDRAYLRTWLAERGMDISTFMRQLNEEGINAIARGGDARYTLGKGTPIRTAQTYTVQISLRHDRLMSLRDEVVETGDDSPAKLVAVS